MQPGDIMTSVAGEVSINFSENVSRRQGQRKVNRTVKQPDWKALPLWPHQVLAVEKVISYLDQSETGSALIRMPTGSGKSGIITVLTRCLDEVKDVLVLCPHEMLRDQLIEDIEHRFFDHIGATNTYWKKSVKLLLPSTASKVLTDPASAGVVFVGTIQALQIIYKTQTKDYRKLSSRVGLVIFDEGHREPAPEWADAVRKLQQPTVLCTATPYRNDLKLFEVNQQFIATLPHQEAEDERFIRHIEFVAPGRWSTANEFVETLLDFWHGRFPRLAPSKAKSPRAIIRCADRDAIVHVVRLLKSRGESAIGVHESFPAREQDSLRRDVPKDPEVRPETFWVHQYKLLEGIDVRDFCLLSLFQPLKNARSLVQQVGRIIRNPDRTPNQKGFVLSAKGDRQQEFWQGYLRYERDFEKDPARSENRQIFDASRDLQPEFQYVDGNYRELFNPDAQKLHERLQFAFSTVVFSIESSFDLDTFARFLEREWKEKDLDVRSSERLDKNTLLLVYISWANSAILRSDALMEFRLGLTICRRINGYLFFNDSEGNLCDFLRENANFVDPEKLERLFVGKTARLSSVSVINSDIGSYSIRRRMIQARSISDTAPGLADHAQFCSTVQGYTEEQTGDLRRRYVGLTRARVSDRSKGTGNYSEYIGWVEDVARELDRTDDPMAVFERFALHSSPPLKPEPRNILVDLDGVAEEFHCEDENHNSVSFETDDLCHDIKSGGFQWLVDGKPYDVSVDFDHKRKRYVLKSSGLEGLFVRTGDRGTEENVISFLNRHQAFRIVPESAGCIYAHGRFYRPRHPLHGRSKNRGIDLLQIFHPVPALETVNSEKGKPNTATNQGWEDGSIFGLLEKAARAIRRIPSYADLNELSNIDFLVCDDLNKETADFIAYRESPKEVIFIHAKDGGGSQLSASNFQEVCGQAMKNLDPLMLYSDAVPRNLSGWDKPWNNGVTGTVKSRIRVGQQSQKAAAIWDLVRGAIRDPNTVRQVWIVLGQGFSRQAFERERDRSHPKPETIQILYLLQSTWNAVGAIGAQLKVFCS
jgi:superfamily II DNA or RNA helicase